MKNDKTNEQSNALQDETVGLLLKKIERIEEQSSLLHNTMGILGDKIDFLLSRADSNYLETKKVEQLASDIRKILTYANDISSLPKPKGIIQYVQAANLKLLATFSEIACKNNLQYWIDFGTLLGAYRHAGFIEWDDDIDISMPREDYERLSSILSIELKDSRFKFVKSEIIRIFVDDLPVQMDIIPWDLYFDKLNSVDDKENFYKIIELVNKEIVYDWNNLNKGMGAIKNLDADGISALRKKIAKLTKFAKSDSVQFISRGVECPANSTSKKREVIDYNIVFPLKIINFCNQPFPCPNMVEEWLFAMYGDYSTWPTVFRNHDFLLKKLTDETRLIELKEFIKS